MQPFDIFVAYVPWGDTGKFRPVLVYSQSADALLAFPITTQYIGKSEAVKSKLFIINDWSYAGLHRQSYVDTGTPLLFSVFAINNKVSIGHLSNADKVRIMEFLGD